MKSYKEVITEAAEYIKIDNRKIPVTKPQRAKKDKIVWVNTSRFDKAWKETESGNYYIGKNGKNGIKDRYKRFDVFVRGGKDDIGDDIILDIDPAESIEVAEISVDDKGDISFTNGRHRFAWMRDQGLDRIPVAMSKDSIMNAKTHKYV